MYHPLGNIGEIQLVQIQGHFLATPPGDEHHRQSANSGVVHRVVRVQPAIWPSKLGFETHDGFFDADLVFVWVLAVARKKPGDGRSSECGPEGIKHGCELEIGRGIVHIVLLQVFALELLAKGVVRLVLGSVGLKKWVQREKIMVENNLLEPNDGVVFCLPWHPLRSLQREIELCHPLPSLSPSTLVFIRFIQPCVWIRLRRVFDQLLYI